MVRIVEIRYIVRERSKFRARPWCLKIVDGVGCACCHFQSSWADDTSEVVDRFCEAAAFLEFEGTACIVKVHEYVANLYDVFLRGF